MTKQRWLFVTILVMSILVAILLPLFLGVRDFNIIGTLFTLVWFVYVVVLFLQTFLVAGRRMRKALKEDKESGKWGYA